jgi:MFS family permease
VTLAWFLSIVAMQGIVLHQVTYLEEQGFPRDSVALALGFIGVVSLPGRFLIPFASERFDARKLSAFTFTAMAGAAICLYGADSWWRVAIYVTAFGMFFGAVIPMRAAVMGGLYSGPAYGRLMGLQGLAIAVGGATGPALIGLLREWTGGYEVPLALSAIILLLAAAIVFPLGTQPSSTGRPVMRFPRSRVRS